MRCEEAVNQLNARVDGELPAEEAAGLNAHLAECSQCRAAAEGIQTVDAELQRRVCSATRGGGAAGGKCGGRCSQIGKHSGIHRAASHASAAAGLGAGARGTGSRIHSGGRGVPAVAVAVRFAGFVAAAAARRPPGGRVGSRSKCGRHCKRIFSRARRLHRSPRIRASAPDRPPNAKSLSTMATLCGSTAIPRSRCTSPKLSRSAADGSGRAISPAARPSRSNRAAARSSPRPAAQLALECQPHATRLIVVDGTVNVQTGQGSTDVGPGKQVRIVQGKVEDDPEWRDALLETAWVNSVLALRSSESSGVGRTREPVVGKCRHREVIAAIRRRAASAGRRRRATTVGLSGFDSRHAECRPASHGGADRGGCGAVALDCGLDRALDR